MKPTSSNNNVNVSSSSNFNSNNNVSSSSSIIGKAGIGRLSRAALCLLLLLTGALTALPVREHAQKWQKFVKDKNWKEAVSYFKQAAAEHPEEAWFQVYIGHALKMQEEYALSLPYFEKALRLKPEDKYIVSNVFYGFLTYANHLGFTNRDWAGSIRWYRRAVAADRANFAGYNMCANALRNAGRVHEALQYMLKSFELNAAQAQPKDPYHANFMATLNAGLNQPDSARAAQWIDLALRSRPEDPQIVTRVVMIHVLNKDADRLAALEPRVKDPTVREPLRGASLLARDDEDGAYRVFTALCASRPRDFKLDELIGEMYRAFGAPLRFGLAVRNDARIASAT